MKISKETWIIMAIGVADLTTTILFIKNHGAEEANPLFKHYWEMGLAAFILAKMALLVGPLSVLEWARVKRPQFVNWALRGAIVAYLVMYGIGFVRLNNVPDAESDYARLAAPSTPLMTRLPGQFHRTSGSVQQASVVAPNEAASETVAY